MSTSLCRPSPGATLLLAAASDLAPLELPLRAHFARSGTQLRFTFGSSGLLATQIRNGAPFDLFLSANQRYVLELARDGHVLENSAVVFARGRLGLWSKTGAVATLQALTAAPIRYVALANPAHAPYGVAARQALEAAGLWTVVAPKIVYAENVRQALQFAESGNADAALTAWALVKDKGGILIGDGGHAPITQTGAIVKRSPAPAEAKAILEFLISPAGQKLLGGLGFSPPPRR